MKENYPCLHKTPTICEIHKSGIKCESKQCEKRHPKLCRYFNRGFYFKNEYCLYLHKWNNSEILISEIIAADDVDNMEVDSKVEQVESSQRIEDKSDTLENSSYQSKKTSKECDICKCEKAKNECGKCGKNVCSGCEFKFNGESVFDFSQSNKFQNYTCSTVHN